MGLLSWITGNSEAADTAANAVVDTLDAIVYTDEEKAHDRARHVDKVLDFKIRYAEATQAASPARRVLALIVGLVWALSVVLLFVAYGLGFKDFASFVYDVLDDVVADPFTVVIMFYFAAHVVKGLKK